jgi:RNase P subunit RPR2
MDAYCVKCKDKVEIKDPKDITMKNSRPAVKGTCSKCGTKVFRIKSKSDK